MITLELNGPEMKRVLKAIVIAACDDPARSSVLGGAHFAINGDIVTTNGSWISLVEAQGFVAVRKAITVPTKALLQAASGIGKAKGKCIFEARREDTSEFSGQVYDLTVEGRKQSFTWTCDDSQFPEYQRVLVGAEPGPQQRFSAVNLGHIADFFITLTGETKLCPLAITPCGDGPAIFQCVSANGINAIAGLMPVRAKCGNPPVDVMAPELAKQVQRLKLKI